MANYFHDAILSLLTIGGCWSAGLREVPDHGQHIVSFDRGEGILGNKVTICAAIETKVLVQQVIAGNFYQQRIILHEFFSQPGVQQGVIEVIDEYGRFWTEIDIGISMDLELKGQKDIELGMEGIGPVFGGVCALMDEVLWV